MTDATLPPAGWYADPGGASVQRYWDGTTWTPHLARKELLTLPTEAVAREQAAARWARVAFAAVPFLYAVVGLVGTRYAADVFDNFDTSGTSTTSLDGSLIGVQIVSWTASGVILVIAWWCFRAAQGTKSLGVPVRREPGWALAAWFIPIISLWWPPQNIRSFVTSRDEVPMLWWWWAAYLVGGALSMVAFIVAIGWDASSAAPVVAAQFLAMCVFGALGWRVVGAVETVHERELHARGLDTSVVVAASA